MYMAGTKFLCFVVRASHMRTSVMKPTLCTIYPVYSVTIPLQVSGLLAAHHQEVTMYICNNWYALYILVDCQVAS
jgi:hypothetical protein